METENKVVLVTSIEQLQVVLQKIIANIPKEPIKIAERKKLTRSQAARFCCISYHTFGKWTREGRFQERGFGRKKFFYEDELIEVLNEKNAKA